LVVKAWEVALEGYLDREAVMTGISGGFRLGAADKSGLRPAKMKTQVDSSLKKKLLSEVALGRVMGPFAAPPLADFQISPLSVIEKKTPGKFRMIHNLSSPRGHSVNEAIPEVLKSVAYCKVADVVDYLLRRGTQGVFLAKFDVKDAFRIVPVHRADWCLLGMAVGGAYFVDTRLPMGCGSSCSIFQSLTRALCWVMEERFPGVRVFGYLDDFLICSDSEEDSVAHMDGFRNLCQELGVPLALDKVEGPSQRLVFLGIGLDLVSWSLYLSKERVAESLNKISAFTERRSQLRKAWQSLVGTLSFLSQGVVPGRPFMTRISRKLSGSAAWIHLDASVRRDLLSWQWFLENRMFRSFVMMDRLAQPSAHIYTDAAGSRGYGAIFGDSWLFGAWDDAWWHAQNIMLLELYPIWVGLQTWKAGLSNSCILVHTDNLALVSALEKRSCKLELANILLRDISLVCMEEGIVLKVEHIPGSKNKLADALSRLQVKEFLKLTNARMGPPEVVADCFSPANCKLMLTSS
jgi:hypothetical protein